MVHECQWQVFAVMVMAALAFNASNYQLQRFKDVLILAFVVVDLLSSFRVGAPIFLVFFCCSKYVCESEYSILNVCECIARSY